jgi:hypothetical protein
MISALPFNVRSIFRLVPDISSTVPAVLISGIRGGRGGADRGFSAANTSVKQRNIKIAANVRKRFIQQPLPSPGYLRGDTVEAMYVPIVNNPIVLGETAVISAKIIFWPAGSFRSLRRGNC